VVVIAEGKRYLYRTGASFVSTRLGIESIPPLTADFLNLDRLSSSSGGLIIAGSYVPKTTSQLECLIQGRGDRLKTFVLDVETLLKHPYEVEKTMSDLADSAGEFIVNGEDVLLMTSRKLITGIDELSSLKIVSFVAAAMVFFLRVLVPRPRYIIAKVLFIYPI
jgi:hypothetical protein